MVLWMRQLCEVADLQAFGKVLINLCNGNEFMAQLHKYTPYQLSVGKDLLWNYCNWKYVAYIPTRVPVGLIPDVSRQHWGDSHRNLRITVDVRSLWITNS